MPVASYRLNTELGTKIGAYRAYKRVEHPGHQKTHAAYSDPKSPSNNIKTGTISSISSSELQWFTFNRLESRLSSTPTSLLFPSHFQVYRNDRNIHGGGVFILVENNIPSSQIMIHSPCEAVWVQIHTHNHSNIILGSFYCPPQSPVQVWDDLAHCVSQIRIKFPDTPLLLGGDFNYPGID